MLLMPGFIISGKEFSATDFMYLTFCVANVYLKMRWILL